MLHHDALRQFTHDHRLHHEAEADAARLALQARRGRDRRSRRLRDARSDAAYIVLTVLPRR